MSFGDPDYKPSKARIRQQYTQNSEKVRLCFKMRCKACDARLVKSSYYVDKPVDPEILKIYKNFYATDHYCKECTTVPVMAPAPNLTDHNAFRYRGRGG